jgi:hypothetical protein
LLGRLSTATRANEACCYIGTMSDRVGDVGSRD